MHVCVCVLFIWCHPTLCVPEAVYNLSPFRILRIFCTNRELQISFLFAYFPAPFFLLRHVWKIFRFFFSTYFADKLKIKMFSSGKNFDVTIQQTKLIFQTVPVEMKRIFNSETRVSGFKQNNRAIVEVLKNPRPSCKSYVLSIQTSLLSVCLRSINKGNISFVFIT